MGQSVLHLSDVYVERGFETNPQAKFQPGQKNAAYGTVRFKVSNKRYISKEEGSTYDKYSIEWRNVSSESKVIGFLNQPGTRVAVYGEASHETYQNNPYTKVVCDGRNSVIITKFGEVQGQAGAPPASRKEEEVPAGSL